jgi:hypothetical protein|tara:strand:- start:3114 stop:3950 length:837 start_codon:yes stop_codon:yes gene_type:complete
MERIRDHVYEFDKLVIGGTLPAFLHGYCNSLPVLYIDKNIPLRFEVSKNKVFDNISKVGLWNRLGAFLSLAGLLPFTNKITSLRILEDNCAEAYTNSRKIKISFNKLLIFDEDKIHGLADPVFKAKKEYKVYDWLITRGMSKHETATLKSDDNFVKEVIFYPSERKGTRKSTRDMVAVSYMTDDQISDLNYSENFARLKAKNMMKEAGLRGYSNGFSKIKQATQYYAIALEHDRRETKLIGRDIYKNSDTILHHVCNEEEIEIKYVSSQLETINKRLC